MFIASCATTRRDRNRAATTRTATKKTRPFDPLSSGTARIVPDAVLTRIVMFSVTSECCGGVCALRVAYESSSRTTISNWDRCRQRCAPERQPMTLFVLYHRTAGRACGKRRPRAFGRTFARRFLFKCKCTRIYTERSGLCFENYEHNAQSLLLLL